MRKALVLLSLASLLPMQAFSAEKKTPEEYWAETGLTTEVMMKNLKLFTPQNCYINIKTFRGCMLALNSISARTEPPSRLVPFALADDASMELGARINSFPGIVQVQIKEAKDEGSLRTNWMKEQAKTKKFDDAEEELFKFKDTTLIDFGGIFESLKATAIKDPKQDPLVAGDAISKFFTEALDAHARIEPKAEGDATIDDADASFAGIGANIQDLKGRIIIANVIENSPAEKAGVKNNDEILAIEGKSAIGMKLDAVVKLIRGPEGSNVTVHFRREEKELDITITRGKILQENVEAKVVEDLGQRIGVIKLRSFMDKNACTTVKAKITSLTKIERVSSLILDLRDNGGGLLDQAVCLGGVFVGKKVVVKIKNLQSNQFEDQVGPANALTQLPMAVLINAGSASASEVLSGALQDHQRAWVVGERSFGKGSVQQSGPFMNNPRISIWATIARFYQPSGRTNQIVGILPDFERAAKPDATEDERFALRERDYFPGALDAESQPWIQTRPDAVATVESCAKGSSQALAKFNSQKAAGKNADYQLLSAEEILSCSASR